MTRNRTGRRGQTIFPWWDVGGISLTYRRDSNTVELDNANDGKKK